MAYYAGKSVTEAIAELEKQGADAFAQGKAPDNCPYFVNTELGKIWVNGYNQAKNSKC